MIRIINPSSCRLGVMPIPLPVVLVSYKDNNESGANLTTASYAGQLSSGQVYVSLRPSRHAFGRMKEGGNFGINYLTPEQAMIADYCGLVSGRDVDKFKATGLTHKVSIFLTSIVEESPLIIECDLERVIEADPSKRYPNSHHIFVGNVLQIRQGDPNAKFLMHRDFQYFSSDNVPLGNVMEIGKQWKPRR